MMTAVKAGAVFGLGMLAGSYLNSLTKDTFEKQSQESVPQDSVATVHKYVPPTIGINEIVSSDTIMYPNTNQPEEINYRDNMGQVKHKAYFNEDGSLAFYQTGCNRGNYDSYLPNGEWSGCGRSFDPEYVEPPFKE